MLSEMIISLDICLKTHSYSLDVCLHIKCNAILIVSLFLKWILLACLVCYVDWDLCSSYTISFFRGTSIVCVFVCTCVYVHCLCINPLTLCFYSASTTSCCCSGKSKTSDNERAECHCRCKCDMHTAIHLNWIFNLPESPACSFMPVISLMGRFLFCLHSLCLFMGRKM